MLEPPLCEAIRRLAGRDRVSLSQKVRDLARDALELHEDAALEELAQERRMNPAPSIPHTELKLTDQDGVVGRTSIRDSPGGAATRDFQRTT